MILVGCAVLWVMYDALICEQNNAGSSLQNDGGGDMMFGCLICM